jgi:hypothetical protein
MCSYYYIVKFWINSWGQSRTVHENLWWRCQVSTSVPLNKNTGLLWGDVRHYLTELSTFSWHLAKRAFRLLDITNTARDSTFSWRKGTFQMGFDRNLNQRCKISVQRENSVVALFLNFMGSNSLPSVFFSDFIKISTSAHTQYFIWVVIQNFANICQPIYERI